MKQVILPHYRLNVAKQQTVSNVSAAMSPLVLGDAIVAPENIFLQALSTNTSPIMIAPVNPAVAGGVGIELPAGGNVSLPGLNASEWYVISAVAGQKLNITYQAGIL